jgi:hypothetical protein
MALVEHLVWLYTRYVLIVFTAGTLVVLVGWLATCIGNRRRASRPRV